MIAEYGTAPPQGSGGLKYYHQDRLSTRAITNATGTVVGTSDNLPFGESFATTGEVEKHRFTNYDRDSESGTDYAVNRQYVNIAGRFMQPDPVRGEVASPQTLNRYSYSTNDPVNLMDPLGLERCTVSDGKGGWIDVPCPKDDPPFDPNEPAEITLRAWAEPFIWAWTSIGPFGPGEFVSVSIDPSTTRPPRPDDKSAFAVSSMLNICGAASSYGQYSNRSGEAWRGANGKWNRIGWGGNGSTGARSLALERAGAFRVLGKSMFYVGMGISAVQGGQSLLQGNYGGAAKSGLDITMGRVGLMGPWGAAASGIYFGVDMTVGWPYVGQELMLTRCDAECQYRLKHCTFANK